jgi:hypothetical protein
MADTPTTVNELKAVELVTNMSLTHPNLTAHVRVALEDAIGHDLDTDTNAERLSTLAGASTVAAIAIPESSDAADDMVKTVKDQP